MADLMEYVSAVLSGGGVWPPGTGVQAINSAVDTMSDERIVRAVLAYPMAVPGIKNPERVPALSRLVMIAAHPALAKTLSQSQVLSPIELLVWLEYYRAGPNLPAAKTFVDAACGGFEERQTPIIRVLISLLYDWDEPDFSGLPEDLNRYHTALVAVGRPPYEIAIWLLRVLVAMEAGCYVSPGGDGGDTDISADLESGL